MHANSAADVPARLEALRRWAAWTGRAARPGAARTAGGRAPQPGRRGRQVSEISVLVRSASTGLVHTERAVLFTADGRVDRGPGGPQLERLLDR